MPSFARKYPIGASLVAFWCIFGRVGLPFAAAATLKTYETTSYVLHTDLDDNAVREVTIRLNRMADEYRARTSDFTGQVTEKFPFYLYRSQADYVADGGLSGTAGIFIPQDKGGKLLVFSGDQPNLQTWHTIQHEGFHQFAHACISGNLPTWLNEGLAEYFAESLFTGDSYQIGIIPPWRLARLKQEISGRTFHPLAELMSLTPDQWQQELALANYDHAWSLVHFLVHADGGKYRQPLAECLRGFANGKSFNQAWLESLGPADGLETRWNAWWLAQGDNPTLPLYHRATVAALTSYLARATAQGQAFPTAADFLAAAQRGQLKMSDADWLPPSLLEDYLPLVRDIPRWRLVPGIENHPAIEGTAADKTQFIGSFKLRGGAVVQVNVLEIKPK